MRPVLAAGVVSLGLLLGACAGMSNHEEDVGAVPVGPEEVQRDLVGKVWLVKLPDGHDATENFMADGTVEIRGGLNDNGRWRLWEKGYCSYWARMRAGAERCFTLDKTKEGHYRIYKPNGDISMTIVGFK
jgi:hypothetical protein